MMRIQVLSDLHLDTMPFDGCEDPSADVVILAGDVARGMHGIEWAIASFSKPVIYVPGNHEFYDHNRSQLLHSMKKRACNTNVSVLHCESILIGNVEFFGATLWTDFDFYKNPEIDMAYAQRNVLDFHIIEEAAGDCFTPSQATSIFEESVAWLDKTLANSSASKKVVITHHAPSAKSVVSRFAGSPLNPAFASRLEPFIEKHAIDLWIHGHMHTALDYELNSTRIVCNPRGYQPYESDNGFESCKVIDLMSQEVGPRVL